MRLFRELHPRTFFQDTWLSVDREADAARLARGNRIDWVPFASFAVAALCLTLVDYFGAAGTFYDVWYALQRALPSLETTFFAPIEHSPFFELGHQIWWSGVRFVCYFLVPYLMATFVLRLSPSATGLSPKGTLSHLPLYLTFYLIVVGPVLLASMRPEFTTYYPFYRHAQRSWVDLAVWEALYALQFFSLEYFFRGFLLGAGRRTMGASAIAAAVVPYCMIHFTKPFVETLGAIVAGTILGTLALRMRSIWGGFLIHEAVAITMDVAALLHKGGLPTTFWPS